MVHALRSAFPAPPRPATRSLTVGDRSDATVSAMDVATAIAAAPSPRPTKPMRSPVVAFTLTRSGAIPSASASRSRIASRCGASFGRSSTTVASTLPISWPRGDQVADDRAQQRDRVRVLPLRIRVREVLADVAEPGGAEQRVDHRVGEDVGVGVAGEPDVVRDRDAAEDQRPAGRERVRVDARGRCGPSPERLHAARAALEHGRSR